jgi:hypothetical protein
MIEGSRWLNDDRAKHREWVEKELAPYILSQLSSNERSVVTSKDGGYGVEGERVNKNVLTVRIIGPDGKAYSRDITFNDLRAGPIDLPSSELRIPLFALTAVRPVERTN